MQLFKLLYVTDNFSKGLIKVSNEAVNDSEACKAGRVNLTVVFNTDYCLSLESRL